jgi:cytochrome c-type biogenesis protein CcsB
MKTFFELSVILYLAATIISIIELFKNKKTARYILFISIIAGFVFHSADLINRYSLSGMMPAATPHEAASFFAWAIVFIYLMLEARFKTVILSSFIMPVVCILMFYSYSLPIETGNLNLVIKSHWFSAHILFAFLSNASFAIAFGIGIMYIVQEHYLKSKHHGGLFQRLPNLQSLDEINYRLITIGFSLLTIAIAIGALWAKSAWGVYWKFNDPRMMLSALTWFIYAGLLHQRLLLGWKGRKTAILSIIGFVIIIASFFAVKLLKKGMHIFQ